MNILTVSGSSRKDSSNTRLLNHLPYLLPRINFTHIDDIIHLPLFRADMDEHPYDEVVLQWRKTVAGSDAVIFCIPEYIHNMPASIKNALEWLTSSGELVGKPVLPITYTPHPPRGEKAMKSLLWSLSALDARIVTSLPLYKTELEIDGNGNFIGSESKELLIESINLLG